MSSEGVPPGTPGSHAVLVVTDYTTKKEMGRYTEAQGAAIVKEIGESNEPFSAMEWECVMGGMDSAPRNGKTYRILWKM